MSNQISSISCGPRKSREFHHKLTSGGKRLRKIRLHFGRRLAGEARHRVVDGILWEKCPRCPRRSDRPSFRQVFMLVQALRHASNQRHSWSEGSRENGILHRGTIRGAGALRGAGSSVWYNTLFQAPLLTDNQFGFPITIQSTPSVAP
jgi:hypothetical protein